MSKTMKTWQAQEAKARFSELLETSLMKDHKL